MSGQLPERIEPLRLAGAGASLQGTVDLSTLSRLAPSLHAIGQETVAVRMHFGVDGEGIYYLRGTLRTVLELTCQRCLGAVRYPVDIEFSLGLAGSADEAERLPDRYEPLVATGESVAVATIVEDELILALPIVAAHADPACARGLGTAPSEITENRMGNPANPFAVLSRLKGKH
jgi:uncharacterized protein